MVRAGLDVDGVAGGSRVDPALDLGAGAAGGFKAVGGDEDLARDDGDKAEPEGFRSAGYVAKKDIHPTIAYGFLPQSPDRVLLP